MHFTMYEPKGVTRLWYVYAFDKSHYITHGAVADAKTVNRVKQILATFRKHRVSPWNLTVMRSEDGKGYRILARCDSHLTYLPSYCGGILFAVDRRRRKKRRRKVAH